MTKAASLAAVNRIDGWLSIAQAESLYDFAMRSQGPIVEIGSYRGKSTAALALGSMAGNKHSVYAVDSFVPVVDTNLHASDDIKIPPSSPELLRSNLDEAGVNGLVRIVAKSSKEAADEIPSDIGFLFVDGAHDYASVKQDIELYAPKVRLGGRIMVHDATAAEPGVIAALDQTLTADARHWQPLCRVGCAVVYERLCDVARHRIALAIPGPSLMYSAAAGIMTATRGAHDVDVRNSGNGWDDMNTLWVSALNSAHRGEITHFAMLHSDINPSVGWLDILASEMQRLGADLVSTVVALKDSRGLSSTGVGCPSDRWNAFRRFTMRELHSILPETFGIADTPHPDKYLLHNTGCWLADLRNPAWRTVDANNMLQATLSFPLGAELMPDGTIEHRRESEDWYFSRMIAGLPLRTFATRKVSATHYGTTPYPNDRPWGDMLFGDSATVSKWGGTKS